jgi:bifunctional non-homologous end joining protein LigD
MLATTGGLPPEDGRWALELKWDGVRAILRARPVGTLAVESRNGRDIAPSYPELQPLAAAVPVGTTVDGEIVAFNERGQPDFGVLQHRMHVSRPTAALQAAVPAVLLVFDILTLADHDTTRLPYDERRGLLDGLALQGPSWQSPAAVDLPGAQLLAASKAQGLEGVMAKRRDSPYLPGIRSPHWVKVKNVRTQDVVIAAGRRAAGGARGGWGRCSSAYRRRKA